ncbi:TPA: hypothetical protein DD449_05200 [Candidatus Berkelbacteria bacterium]|uniref:Uncharacterized protein n=1 Tax=Berkelbacteria bacterium GW2011_GWE1_39_12 TaxID=1618337 RepID=A0A0G4B615_9BACT|nr:MAG: hypothetical protein UT28_C0001G0658 [Berkelbacteria bacterium GW2011_GWE1_39_12]HBO61049.1 hypothetical protein [Candidatus Berkelbacteria bacterium]
MKKIAKVSTFWKIVLCFNIAEILIFVFSRISSFIEPHLSFQNQLNLDSIVGTYYFRLSLDVLILNFIFFFLSVLGIFLTFQNKTAGKILLVVSGLFFLINSLPDFLGLNNFLFCLILILITCLIINKFSNEV